MLPYVVHRIVCGGSQFVHSDNGAVTNGAAIVPGHVRPRGNGLEGLPGRCHGVVSVLVYGSPYIRGSGRGVTAVTGLAPALDRLVLSS